MLNGWKNHHKPIEQFNPHNPQRLENYSPSIPEKKGCWALV